MFAAWLLGAYDSIIDLCCACVSPSSPKQASSFDLTYGRADRVCPMIEGIFNSRMHPVWRYLMSQKVIEDHHLLTHV